MFFSSTSSVLPAGASVPFLISIVTEVAMFSPKSSVDASVALQI